MRLLPLILIFLPTFTSAQYLVKGKIDSTFAYEMAHLDILDNWNEFKSVSDEMVIKSVEINEDGTFQFSGNELSEKYGFYRVRYSKKEKGVSINFGKRNYTNFILSNKDTIQILNTSFIPNSNQNKLFAKYIERNDSFTKARLNPENERHSNLVLSKYQEYCKEMIHANNVGLLNLFCLATSEIEIKNDPSLFKKVNNNLQNSFIRPQYSNSLNKIIHQYDFKSVERNSNLLKYVLAVSFLLNLILGWYIFKRKNKKKNNHEIAPIKTLTNKELEVLEWINSKKTNKEIAAELFISEATVKTHINNIYRKLNVKSRKEALEVYNSQ